MARTTDTRSAATLTAAQAKALGMLAAGPVFSGNGVSLRTVRALERAGLATVETEITKSPIYKSFGRSFAGYRTSIDWKATAVEGSR